MKRIATALQFLSRKLDRWSNRLNKERNNRGEEQQPFHPLSPTGEADQEGHYKKALLWAIKNSKLKDIHNIALTGPYGSGKSSILKTFRETNQDDALKFLNISLATFKDTNDTNDTKDTKETIQTEKPSDPVNSDLLRLIELSILQQIFYHEEDRKIPDSRFKKIKNFSRKNIILTATSLLIFGFSIVNLCVDNFVGKALDIEVPGNANRILRWFSITYSIAWLYAALATSVRSLRGISINKLNISNAEIEIDKNISKSILNNHLDEILYFFEVTDYSVVIVEDLDRFEQTEIFTKLRELNLLINNSKKIKRDIVFVYAVRDDMFKDKDRTKFFDFIIPIIPVINFSNSNEKLKSIIKNNGYTIDDELVNDISLFIDDMRLLYNIMNEYEIYWRHLDKKLNQNKLLAVIVYKNIFPNDFVSLNNNDGELYKVFQEKSNHVHKVIAKTEETIKTINASIDKLNELKIRELNELRKVYLYQLLSKLNNIISFSVDGTSYDIQKMLDDEPFIKLTKDEVQYKYYHPQYSNYFTIQSGKIPRKFSEIEKEVDPKSSYLEREELIKQWNDNKIGQLKEELSNLNRKKSDTRKMKLNRLMAENPIHIKFKNEKQGLLINSLIRSGHIDEDYLDYVSIFYEGSITKEDRDFLLSLKSQISKPYDYKLQNIEGLLKKIGIIEWESIQILNINLLDFVIENQGYQNEISSMMHHLRNESPQSLEFIDGYMNEGKNAGLFFRHLCQGWPKCWDFFKNRSRLPGSTTDEYFKLMMNNAGLNDIIAMADFALRQEIEDRSDFLLLLEDTEKAKDIIDNLKIKFTNLDISSHKSALQDHVYKTNSYAINKDMLASFIRVEGKFDQKKFITSNYGAILDSECPGLINYVNKNLELYIEKVYLKIYSNNQEDEKVLTHMLNSADIAVDWKKKIIKQVATIITDIRNIDDNDVKGGLFTARKIKPTWQNVIRYYNETDKEIDENLIEFLNHDRVAIELFKHTIDPEKLLPDLPTTEDFIISLITEDKIDNQIYDRYLKCVPHHYSDLEITGLSKDKVLSLIQKGILDATPENFNTIGSSFTNLKVPFLEKHHDKVVETLDNFPVGRSELTAIMDSAAFTNSEKKIIVNHYVDSLLLDDPRLCNNALKLEHKQPGFITKEEDLINILRTASNLEDRLRVFIKKLPLLNQENTSTILGFLPEPYAELTQEGKRPLLPGNTLNRELAAGLQKAKYISSHQEDDKGIRLNTFKKSKE
ncbi:MAG: hypothetical protein E6Q24_05040 [Chitinophagaceae bacterium]|nr:MAG: hypothetical protein E6Q24_05040 [Chitinophagaceae bacterium]